MLGMTRPFLLVVERHSRRCVRASCTGFQGAVSGGSTSRKSDRLRRRRFEHARARGPNVVLMDIDCGHQRPGAATFSGCARRDRRGDADPARYPRTPSGSRDRGRDGVRPKADLEDTLGRPSRTCSHRARGSRHERHPRRLAFLLPTFVNAESRASRRQDLESGLRRALARGEFVVHYSRRPRLADGADDLRGGLHPMEQPRAGWLCRRTQSYRSPKRPGLIEPIGAWVLETAAAQAAGLADAGLRELRMCVPTCPRGS